MLVITRRPGESVFVGDDIVIHILSVKGNQVRVGIDAPANVNIMRNELAPHDTPRRMDRD